MISWMFNNMDSTLAWLISFIFMHIFSGYMMRMIWLGRHAYLAIGCGQACCPGNICGQDGHHCRWKRRELSSLHTASFLWFFWEAVILIRIFEDVAIIVAFIDKVPGSVARFIHKIRYGPKGAS